MVRESVRATRGVVQGVWLAVRCTAVCAVLGLLAAAPAAGADTSWPPANATWTQSFITEPDGTTLHADVLRPKGSARTPVILSIGPYFNHSGQTGPAGPVEGTSYDPLKRRITLPFLQHSRTATLTGYKRPARLDQWVQDAPFSVDQSTIAASTSPGFQLPPPQTP